MFDFTECINYDAINNMTPSELKRVNAIIKNIPSVRKDVWTVSQIENLINRYYEKGGVAITIEDGCLGYGKMILCGDGLKTTIVNEVYLNEWSSGHTVRMYNKCPKKYEKFITAYYES